MSIYRSPEGERLIRQRYLDLLERWPVPSERRTVPTRHGDTFVLASGPEHAPPVLALHGSAGNAAGWLPRVAAWTRDRRVYAVDVIGEPGLSAPSRPPLASAEYASWLDDVLDGLALTSTSIVAESLGGWFALDYATRRPERITELALLNPSGIGRRKVGVLLKYALLRPFGDRGLRKALVLAAGPAALAADHQDPIGAALLELNLLTTKHFRPRMEPLPTFPDDRLRELTMPILTVLGARDAMLDAPGTARRLAEAVPHARVRVLPDAGHYLPDQSLTIADFLRDPTGARS
ncbi:alpha/beta fold hydrolase [Amycolatopsis anabasis]|uniref:alpha/beta fold hydrolase n=1 Tax=Amycolatopsis anabasis TaxID=1840409 RepID=UPI00131DFAD2|nr:alpha/beta fold hydrolase [Amycolatopsis anabasis]